MKKKWLSLVVHTSTKALNNDMMPYRTCNKIFLFAQRQGKKILQMFLKCKTLIHYYMKLKCERTRISQKTLFHSIQNRF